MNILKHDVDLPGNAKPLSALFEKKRFNFTYKTFCSWANAFHPKSLTFKMFSVNDFEYSKLILRNFACIYNIVTIYKQCLKKSQVTFMIGVICWKTIRSYRNNARWFVLGTLHKKWSFPLRISSVNVTKSVVSCGFRHIYWRNP